MKTKIIWFIVKVILLLLLQIWIFNNLYLFRYATPYPYLIILLLLPISINKLFCTLIGGGLGIILDIFSGLPGLHTAAFTATAFVRNYLLTPFVDTDTDRSRPLSFRNYIGRILLLLIEIILIHHFIFFGLDAFDSFNWSYIGLRFAGSVIFTFMISFIILLILTGEKEDNSRMR